jgi:chemotaxis protein MotB
MSDELAPIIVKRIKKVEGGHHGGAWKVAYADFVTAMMAFFLLMWLLNATESDKLAGLAEFFAPTVGLKDAMGIGFRGGKGLVERGIGVEKDTNKGLVFGAPAGSVIKSPVIQEEMEEPDEEKIKIDKSDGEKNTRTEEVAELESSVTKKMNEIVDLDIYRDSMQIKQVPEGIAIEMADKEQRPMFARFSADLEPHAKDILDQVAEILTFLPNHFSVIGHTSSIEPPESSGDDNWGVSVQRANVVRQYLIDQGVAPEQFSKLVGLADQRPIDPQNPDIPFNDRVDIIILKQSLQAFHNKVTPDAVFVDPRKVNTDALIQVNPNKKMPKEETPAEPAPVVKEKAPEPEPAAGVRGWDPENYDGGEALSGSALEVGNEESVPADAMGNKTEEAPKPDAGAAPATPEKNVLDGWDPDGYDTQGSDVFDQGGGAQDIGL